MRLCGYLLVREVGGELVGEFIGFVGGGMGGVRERVGLGVSYFWGYREVGWG